MNRILKNVIDAPKQDLFIKVLDNLPPSKDATDAESIYKTIFDMYTNRGELFKQVAQPLIAALIRSLMKGSILSDELKQSIKENSFLLYRGSLMRLIPFNRLDEGSITFFR